MKMKMLGAVFFLALLGMVAKSDDSPSQGNTLREHWKKVLDEAWPALMEGWTPVAIGAIDSREYFPNRKPVAPDAAEVPKGSVRMIGKVPLNERSQKYLRNLLISEVIPTDGKRSGCYYPRHAIVFQKDTSTFTMVICFQCREVNFIGAAPEGEWRSAIKIFSTELRGYLDGQLDAGGVDRSGSSKAESPQK
jgi:hypothetical protein